MTTKKKKVQEDGLSGVNNVPFHQIIITRLICGFMNKIERFKKYENYIATPELNLDPVSKKLPDISVWNYEKESHHDPKVIIEICWSHMLNKEVKKINTLMKQAPSMEEAFIIMMDTKVIKRIHCKKDGTPSLPVKKSKCESFNLDLLDCIPELK